MALIIKVEYEIIKTFEYKDRIVKKTLKEVKVFNSDLEYDLWFEKTRLSMKDNYEIKEFKYLKFL